MKVMCVLRESMLSLLREAHGVLNLISYDQGELKLM